MIMKKVLVLVLASTMTVGAYAQSADEKKVAEAVETLRTAMIDPTKDVLEKITSDALSYGHSSGKVDTKASFIDDLLTGKSDFVSINLADQTIKISDNVALVRHKLTGETLANGTKGAVNLYVLLVFQKQKGDWRLIARHAAKAS